MVKVCIHSTVYYPISVCLTIAVNKKHTECFTFYIAHKICVKLRL